MLSYAPPQPGSYTLVDSFERTSSKDARAHAWGVLGRVISRRYDSEYLSRYSYYVALLNSVNELHYLRDDWNSYGSPAPSPQSIDTARLILEILWARNLVPIKALPSADGGVALIFRPDNDNRAIIEMLNENETHLLLYDRQGNSKTLVWENLVEDKDGIIKSLQVHLRGERLATS